MKNIAFSIPDELVEKIDEISKALYEHRSEFIRRAIMERLERLEHKGEMDNRKL